MDTDLLLELYWGFMLNVIEKNQITSIRFECDCIHIFGLDDKLLDELEYARY